MKSSWIHLLGVASLLAIVAMQPVVAAAQDAPAPADETEAARAAEAGEGEADQKKFDFGLYVEVGVGTSSISALDTTLATSSSQISLNSIEFEDMEHSRAAVGWELPGIKGRFRLAWQGFKEDGYAFNAVGRQGVLGSGGVPVTENLDWWNLSIVDGDLEAIQSPPAWDPMNDANMNGTAQRDEVTYPMVTFTNTAQYEPNLQNRAQVTDALYGRAFGPRRFEGVWWGGLRYFVYEGTLLQGAWVRSQGLSGEGFTEGAFLRPLAPSQNAKGIGPTGSLGLRVNFFEKRFQLFAMGQFAFLLTDLETETGNFVTVTNGNDTTTVFTSVANLTAERDRTTWHTHIEGGARVNLKKGLIWEITYFAGAFMDVVLTPTEMRIPQNAQELGQGTSAIFATQDLRYDGWRSSLAFQF